MEQILKPHNFYKVYINMEFFSLKDFNLKNKTVVIRADLNIPYNSKTGKLSENTRLREHVKTIKKLQELGAKIILLAHQGRKGKDDFISLEKHINLLEKYLEKTKFIKFGESLNQIKGLNEGEVILLDNVRFYEDETEDKSIEEHSNSKLIKDLVSLIDYFILDAFSVAHRCHASVVGFATLKPCIVGPVFERELKNLIEFSKKLKNSKSCFILGGAKPKEPLNLMESWIENDAIFLTTGVLCLLFLIAKNYRLGYTEEFLENKGYLKYLDKTKKLLNKFENKIKSPIDLAVNKDGKRVEISLDDLPTNEQILDIGIKTVDHYKKEILNSDFVCLKGPAGVYETKNFELGTKNIFELLEKNSLVGGGNTTDALEKLGIDFNQLGYVSLGGGAFVEFLTGKELPGIKALKISFEKFKNLK
jgi:phosphoglycerate kinase